MKTSQKNLTSWVFGRVRTNLETRPKHPEGSFFGITMVMCSLRKPLDATERTALRSQKMEDVTRTELLNSLAES